ncbi:putative RNA-directed DNA polymerase [Helianthus annuus]|nr:putative RNA-directed DNA polymerase [Helianthus annuus]
MRTDDSPHSQTYSTHVKQIFLFKADIEKAYDTLNWKFLISVLMHMGFPPRWRTWMMGILFSCKASVLVNGSPTGEFQYKRGLRQGDPLSPFLFTIAMEALHVLMAKAVETGVFKGLALPNSGPRLTHLFFADDSIFLGLWDKDNLCSIRRILRVFFLMSGLKVNHSKSCLYGIGLTDSEVENMAGTLNCKMGQLPFTYLGLKVGANMNRVCNWKEVIDKFHKRLSNWKARLLSFAGRLTLVKAVLGSLPNYFLSLYKIPKKVAKILEGIRSRFLWGGCGSVNKIRWMRWERIIAAKSMGGLGIGGIRDMNLALMMKWRWRLKVDSEQLWVKVIEAIHCNKRVAKNVPLKKSLTGVWKSIVGVEGDFSKIGIDVNKSLRSKVGSGNKTMFWLDTWATSGSLKDEFPLSYNLAKNKRNSVQQNYKLNQGGVLWDWKWSRLPTSSEEKKEWEALSAILLQQSVGRNDDMWSWKENTAKGFSVKDVRKEIAGSIDVNMAPGVFEWSKIATAKVNLFVWRAAEGRIPTKIALASRGIQVGSTVCKVCGAAPETADHIFIQCLFAKEVWLLLWSWMYTPGRNHNESLKTRLLEKQDWPRRKERIIYAIHLLAVWSLWKNRNYKVFNDSNATPSKIVEDIKEEAFDWVKLRTKISGISWEDWKKFDLRGLEP